MVKRFQTLHSISGCGATACFDGRVRFYSNKSIMGW
jgi:hypothetical protein